MNTTNYQGQSGEKCLVERGGAVFVTYVYCVSQYGLHVSWNPLHSDTFEILPRNDRFFDHTVLLASKLRLHFII